MAALNAPKINTRMLKLYRITDTARLDQIDVWVADPENRSWRIQRILGDETVHQLMVEDHALTYARSPLAEAALGDLIEITAWPVDTHPHLQPKRN